MKRIPGAAALLAAVSIMSACSHEQEQPAAQPAAPQGASMVVTVDTIAATLSASGTAEPYAQATLSTRLMGTVTAVHVREGDVVKAGQLLLTIDARDLNAKAAQIAASLAEAEAMRAEAARHAERMRALYREEAAPKAQLDAAETGLARADAAVQAARAGASELGAVQAYAALRAPFDGIVTARLVDPGSFAAPGAPLLTLQDAARLRVSVTTAPLHAAALRRGAVLQAEIEGAPAQAVVEGVVPAAAGLYRVNAVVNNPGVQLLSGGAATLALASGSRPAMLLPRSAIRNAGELTSVLVTDGTTSSVRYVRVGDDIGGRVEVLSGLRAGERVIIAPNGAL